MVGGAVWSERVSGFSREQGKVSLKQGLPIGIPRLKYPIYYILIL